MANTDHVSGLVDFHATHRIGAKVFIRTVTFHFVGRIVAMNEKEIFLDCATWVADSGRYGEALANGTLAEHEPYPYGVAVSIAAIVDISPWLHRLPNADAEASDIAEMYGRGKKVFIRTVTFHFIGAIEDMDETYLLLSEPSWVADSGRFGTALKTGELSESEPYPNSVTVMRASIVDVSPWRHALPREAK